MLCRKCGSFLDGFENECPHCAKAPPPESKKPHPIPRRNVPAVALGGLAAVLLGLCLLASFAAVKNKPLPVQTGKRMVCSQCGRVIANSVTTVQVRPREAARYKVEETKGICNRCANPAKRPVPQLVNPQPTQGSPEDSSSPYLVQWNFSDNAIDVRDNPLELVYEIVTISFVNQSMETLSVAPDDFRLLGSGGNSYRPDNKELYNRAHSQFSRSRLFTFRAVDIPPGQTRSGYLAFYEYDYENNTRYGLTYKGKQAHYAGARSE